MGQKCTVATGQFERDHVEWMKDPDYAEAFRRGQPELEYSLNKALDKYEARIEGQERLAREIAEAVEGGTIAPPSIDDTQATNEVRLPDRYPVPGQRYTARVFGAYVVESVSEDGFVSILRDNGYRHDVWWQTLLELGAQMLGAPPSVNPGVPCLSDVEVAGVYELWARHVRRRLAVIDELRARTCEGDVVSGGVSGNAGVSMRAVKGGQL